MSRSQSLKILIIYAHPHQDDSVANKAMIAAAQQLKNLTIVDLYAQFPDGKIDIPQQQQLLASHDILIFQFPLYWYSSPALLKQWQDVVLQHGINYGSKISILDNKLFLCAVTAGVDAQELATTGRQETTLSALFSPFDKTFSFCKMQTLPAFLLFDAPNNQAAPQIAQHADAYTQLLIALSEQLLDYSQAQTRDYLNQSSLPLIQEKSI